MGTSAPPDTGYKDDQRTANWDSPILYGSTANVLNAPETTPPLNVSRYAYIAGYDVVTNFDALVTLTWFADQAQTIQVGKRQFTLSGNIPVQAQYRLPNLGPWLVVQWSKTGANGPTHSTQLFGTNRFHPLEFIPSNPVLVDMQNQLVNAGFTSTVYPFEYYAGPVDIWWFAPAAAWTLAVDRLTPAGAWVNVWVTPPTTASGYQQFKVVVPAGAWRVLSINSSAVNGSYYLSVRHPQTGST